MRILFLNNCWPTSLRPNEGTYAKTIVEVLEKAGCDVGVCAMRRRTNKVMDYLRFCIELALKPLPRDTILYINHYVFMFPLMVRLLFTHRQCIYHWHGEELLAEGRGICFLRWLMRKTFCHTDVHISPSHYYTNIIADTLGIPQEKIKVSPSGGVDTTIFRVLSHPLKEEGVIHIGYSAGLSDHKGMRQLMEIICARSVLEERLKRKVHFHVIEYGNGLDVFKAFLIQGSVNDVTLYPKFEKNKMPDFYKHIQLLLFLSKRESLGLTALESMSCGIPVLARDICSMREMVRSGITGELVSSDPTRDELIEKIVLMSSCLDRYNPREFILTHYSQESVIDDYREILSEIGDCR